MLLDGTRFGPEMFLHLERYVNRGSPSGFSERYTTSPATSAKGDEREFHLCGVRCPSSFVVQEFGSPPHPLQQWHMLVHPDMIGDELFASCLTVEPRALAVSPTASSRTVRVTGENGWFFKLHYKGMIGRIERQLGLNQAQSAFEVSSVIGSMIDQRLLPESFFMFREVFARVIHLPQGAGTYEWGIVAREPQPYPLGGRTAQLVPAFSLFSRDEKAPDDPSVLAQLVEAQRKPVADFLFEELIAPVYDAYFSLLLTCGLQLEAHAQNMLFALDDRLQVCGVVARDAESIDKDHSLITELGLPNRFSPLAYKSLHRHQYNYQIMHSFMYDFKLGEYLITPLIDEAARHYPFDRDRLVERIREHNRGYLARLPTDFFPPDGKWYSYANIVHDQSGRRPYIAQPNPTFR